MAIANSGFIGDEEVRRLLFGLSIVNSPKNNKRALQDICIHYEAGRRLKDTSEIRQLIHSHLGAGDILLRRWSLKALGLIGSPLDTQRILDRLRVETDYEAVTWGTAALFKNPGTRTIKDIAKDAGLATEKPLVLAARLYADDDWIRQNVQDVTISLNDDALILKWAIFLAGYNKAPPALFDPRYENELFLGELNNHDVNEVSEYSIWALWERPDFGAKHLRIPFTEVLKHPENVRKWLYRLYTQSHAELGIDNNIVHDLRANDASPAREGLAKGIVDANLGQFDSSILAWQSDEADPSIKAILLSGMVRRADHNIAMREIIEYEFGKGTYGLRQTLLAAAVGRKIYGVLRSLEAQEKVGSQGTFALSTSPVVIIQPSAGGTVNMTNGNSFNIGGNLNAQNVAGGDIVESAHGAVQNISAANGSDKEVLETVLQFLRNVDQSLPEVQAAYGAVAAAAKIPSKENKTSLFGALKGLSKVVAFGGGLAEIIALVGPWIG